MTDPRVGSSKMAAEMAEQPTVAARLLAARVPLAERIWELLPSGVRGVAFVGRGSSENAALFGRWVVAVATGRPALVVPLSVLGHARAPAGGGPPYEGYLAVGISQSGETPEVVDGLRRLRRAGAATVALTAAPRSLLARSADLVVDLETGAEQAVPATKTFTASLVAMLLLAGAVGSPPWSEDDLDAIPAGLAGVLADVEPARAAAARLAGRRAWGCVGRGPMQAIAAEAALKLEEVALVVADHHSSISFRHGPIATTGSDRPLLALAAGATSTDDTVRLAHDAAALGSPVVVVAPPPAGDLPLPRAWPEPLAAVAAGVRSQQLALALAEQLGLDPDRPPGLDKVTRT